MAETLLTIGGAAIVAAITAWGIIYAARADRKSAQETTEYVPYSDLAEDVRTMRQELRDAEERIKDQGQSLARLTRRVSTLEEDQDVLIDALAEQHAWQEAGATPPPPAIHTKALRLIRLAEQRRHRTTD